MFSDLSSPESAWWRLLTTGWVVTLICFFLIARVAVHAPARARARFVARKHANRF